MSRQGDVEFDWTIKLTFTLPDSRIHSRLILYCLASAMNLSKGGLSLLAEGLTSHPVWVQKQDILNDRCGPGPLATSMSKLSSQSGLYAWEDDAYIVHPSHGTTALFLWEWWLGIYTILPSWCPIMRSALIIIEPMIFLSAWDCLCNGIPRVQGNGECWDGQRRRPNTEGILPIMVHARNALCVIW